MSDNPVNECCGKTLLTPFCPFCGKPNRDPLLQLVEYLRGKAAKNRKQHESRRGKNANADCWRIAAERYEAWAEAVLNRALHIEKEGTDDAQTPRS